MDKQTAVLTGHPSTPNEAVRSIGVQLWTEEPDILALRYSLVADMSRVRVGKPRAAERSDALWQHTCFEAFVAARDSAGYYEFNFSPSLHWAIYRFSAYREGMSLAEIGVAPAVSVQRGEDALELNSAVRLGDLRGLDDAPHLRIALAAVIEDNDGRLSYWSLRHPPGKPDFHHSNGFTLDLTRP